MYKFLLIILLILIGCNEKDISNFREIIPNHMEFIAHAGGSIEGNIYTNSLEALDHNYAKGCRMFELDLHETTDGKLVAIHEWKQFKEITNYKGTIDDTPLSEKDILKLKIYGKYTPLNMSLINEWFKNHPDAILVTDKLNKPVRLFAKQDGFLYKNRCMMELFDWDAVDIAIQIGVTPIVSQKVIFDYSVQTNQLKKWWKKESSLRKLKNRKIEYVCFSVKMVESQSEFVQKLKEMGIKTYVYHINYNPKIDENFVHKNYLNLITGMYADNLDLLYSNSKQ